MGHEWDNSKSEKRGIRKREEGSLGHEHGVALVIRHLYNHGGVMAGVYGALSAFLISKWSQ